MTPLWLALHFPLLALEAEHGCDEVPRVLARRQQVILANAAAGASGVDPGLRLGTAHALCEGLQVHEPDPQCQQQALEREGHRLLKLTPQVCPAPPDSLLLEVGGCLSLFGGLSGLLAQVERYRLHCPLTTRLGLGPTPLAARHLIDSPLPKNSSRASDFQAQLAALPLAELELPSDLKNRLQAPGFRTLADLLALPRPALGKRFGASFLDWLQRLLGSKPDPRRPLPAPRPFREKETFDQPLTSLGLLERPMTRLLGRLQDQLDDHQEEVAAIRWHLLFRHRNPDTIIVRRARPSHDAAAWLELSQRRLEHHRPDAEILGLGLDTSRPRPRNPARTDLFDEPGARSSLGSLLEKLASEPMLELYQLRIAGQHLPEQNETVTAPFTRTSPSHPSGSPSLVDRPPWLLDPPVRLHAHDHNPLWRGRPLHLFPQEERFSQPWQDLPSRRYRIAHHPEGLCCWVFQDGNRQWWLQGFF